MKQVFLTLKYTVKAEEINGQYVAWIIAEYVNKVLPEYNDTQKRLVCKRSEGGYFLGTDLAMAVLFDEKDHAARFCSSMFTETDLSEAFGSASKSCFSVLFIF